MKNLRIVGQRALRTDAVAKATGRAKFTADMRKQDMLTGKALFAAYPHALIKSIDVSEALKVPGVVTVMTAKDLPGRNGYGVMVQDKPVIADGKTHYEGDPVALVAAVSEDAAREALKRIKVDYEPLPAYDDPRDSMKDGAVKIHENHPTAEDGNILVTLKLDRGDVEQAFAAADIIIENEYETPMVEHCYLEADVCIAEPDPLTGGLTIISPAQAVYANRRSLAGVFGIPHNRLRIVSPLVGGGFGGKEDSCMDVSAMAGVLALKCDKPVYMALTREEVFRTTGKRHATYITHRLAATKEGKLLAVDVRTVLNKGAYVSMGGMKEPLHAVTMRTLVYAAGAYHVPHARARSHSVFTNTPYSCAFRGFGVPQATFAMECQMDELARRVKMDPVALRRLNMLRHNDRTITGQVMLESRGLGLGECIDKVTDSFGWNKPLPETQGPVKKGKGFAVYMYGTGIPLLFEGSNCYAHLQLDGTLTVAVSCTEMGQGITTALAQIAAETLGIRIADILVEISDTAKTPDSGPTVGSRSAVMVGNAVFDACVKLRERMLDVASRHLFSKADPRDLIIEDGIVSARGKPEMNYPLSAVAAKAYNSQVPLAVVGSWFPPQASFSAENGQGNPCHAYAFGAQAVEVDVDTETGVVTVQRAAMACDVGKALNPLNVEGQMEGGSAQGFGWAVMEECIMENGVMRNAAFHNYMIPTIKDMPKMQTIVVEHPNELGPYGAKGVGEPATIGMAPAIRNAVCDALGIKINVIPLTARQIIQSLNECASGR